MNANSNLDSIEDALEDIRNGKVVIVVDDEDRENEGDFIAAAECVTPEMINFMATHGRGLICAPLTQDRCKELGLDLMVSNNTVLHETQFTVSVDLKGHGCTTGISVHDRSKTIKALVSDDTKPEDLGRPGHIFPLRAKDGGVLRRTGHTEASIDLARLAGLKPAGILVEILNEDGSMARLPQLKEVAKKFDLKLISIEDLIAYRMETESLIEREFETTFTNEAGTFKLVSFKQTTTGESHIALVKGGWEADEPIMVRVHSSFLEGNILDNSCNCTAGKELYASLQQIEAEGKGVVLYMQQKQGEHHMDMRHKMEGFDSIDAKVNQSVKMDQRDYGVGAQILRNLGITKMKLMSNHQKKRTGLVGYGLEVVEYVPLMELA